MHDPSSARMRRSSCPAGSSGLFACCVRACDAPTAPPCLQAIAWANSGTTAALHIAAKSRGPSPPASPCPGRCILITWRMKGDWIMHNASLTWQKEELRAEPGAGRPALETTPSGVGRPKWGLGVGGNGARWSRHLSTRKDGSEEAGFPRAGFGRHRTYEDLSGRRCAVPSLWPGGCARTNLGLPLWGVVAAQGVAMCTLRQICPLRRRLADYATSLGPPPRCRERRSTAPTLAPACRHCHRTARDGRTTFWRRGEAERHQAAGHHYSAGSAHAGRRRGHGLRSPDEPVCRASSAAAPAHPRVGGTAGATPAGNCLQKARSGCTWG